MCRLSYHWRWLLVSLRLDSINIRVTQFNSFDTPCHSGSASAHRSLLRFTIDSLQETARWGNKKKFLQMDSPLPPSLSLLPSPSLPLPLSDKCMVALLSHHHRLHDTVTLTELLSSFTHGPGLGLGPGPGIGLVLFPVLPLTEQPVAKTLSFPNPSLTAMSLEPPKTSRALSL
jgi:hypothetical protein